MGLNNWVRFIILSVLMFALVLVITYSGEIWNAILAFPLDLVVSFLLGALVMFLSNFKITRKHNNSNFDA